MFRPSHIAAIAGLAAASASALAYQNDMLVGSQGSAIGSFDSALDIASTSWDFPVMTSGKLDSGYKAEILDPGTNMPLFVDGSINPNRASLVSEVHEVTSATSYGSIGLLPGDLIFSYHLTMVGSNTNTVSALREFSVKGATGIFDTVGGGDGFFTPDMILGRGYSTAGLANPATHFPMPGNSAGNGTDLEVQDFGTFGGFSQLDFTWSSADDEQLGNTQQITLLLFARNAIVGDGFGKFFGNSLGAVSSTDALADNAPILIPIPAPTPGTLALAAVGGIAVSRRRRS